MLQNIRISVFFQIIFLSFYFLFSFSISSTKIYTSNFFAIYALKTAFVDKFFRHFLQFTAIIDKWYTLYGVVENFPPQLVVLVDKFLKFIATIGFL
jgi:hypothetical protein